MARSLLYILAIFGITAVSQRATLLLHSEG
jgi:hypothetical protein